MALRLRVAVVAFATALSVTSGASAADLPEQRLVCQQEARQNIKGPPRIDLDLYKRIVERRQLYVRECMANGPRDVEQTGSIVAPLPPRRPAAHQGAA
jgi:hypothetical protein